MAWNDFFLYLYEKLLSYLISYQSNTSVSNKNFRLDLKQDLRSSFVKKKSPDMDVSSGF